MRDLGGQGNDEAVLLDIKDSFCLFFMFFLE